VDRPTPRLCALVLAAGEGRRLRPLTATVPKALCPIGNVALLDRALARLAALGLTGPEVVAVNACYLADRVVAHVGSRAHVAVEPGPPALGTAGAVANLRDWIAGRAVLVGNADAYLGGDPTVDLRPLLNGWDGTTVRLLAVPAGDRPAEFGGHRFAGFSLLPADVAGGLPPGRSDLVGEVWRPAERSGRLEIVEYPGFYLDSGTPADYLSANLHAAGSGSLVAADAVVTGPVDHSVIGAGARVHGALTRCVVLPGGHVDQTERLVDVIRVGPDVTVPAARSGVPAPPAG
jgi:N-acetyl-alpha-D-muramate 1-phosphate uridylyltransferase